MHLEKLDSFQGRKGPLLLVVADGVGIAEPGPANAVSLADTPIIDNLLESDFRVDLRAHGVAVGLPSDDDMGNSEVGHNTLGGGRIFAQGAKLVNQAFDDKSLFSNANWKQVEQIGLSGSTVHFLGLLSDGNVHSNIEHLFALLQRCHDQEIQSVAVHALLDGRDVDPRSASIYLQQLQTKLDSLNSDLPRNYRLASAGGRMIITMDRYDADWAMVERGWACHVNGDAHKTRDALAEVQRQYDADPNTTDQTLEPFVLVDENDQPVGKIVDGDAVVLFNFRGDRAMEISRAFEEDHFTEFNRGPRPDIFYCGMLQYDGDLFIPKQYLVDPPKIDQPMVEYLCAEKLPSFAVSETQKFGHVTYFWNGNRSSYFDESLETHVEVPSDNVPFDTAPEMKADEIADETIKLLRSGRYRFGRINFANGDMVGHTGDVQATIRAMQAVDRNLSKLIDVVMELDGVLIFTADHGNADEMFVEKDNQRVEKTSHTLNPVPFVIVDGHLDKPYQFGDLKTPGLANVAATVFNLMGYQAPTDYLPSLIEFDH